MIICSCNVFSDQQLHSALAKATQRLRMSQIYDCLGASAQCGQCAHTIKLIMGQVANRAIASVAASTKPSTHENAITRPPQPARRLHRRHSGSTTSEPVGQRLNVMINNRG